MNISWKYDYHGVEVRIRPQIGRVILKCLKGRKDALSMIYPQGAVQHKVDGYDSEMDE